MFSILCSFKASSDCRKQYTYLNVSHTSCLPRNSIILAYPVFQRLFLFEGLEFSELPHFRCLVSFFFQSSVNWTR